MKFAHTETREDFGGTITVTAETAPEVVQLSEHFRMHDMTDPAQLMALAEATKAGTLTYTSSPTAKRPWYLVESALDFEFTKPYADLLEKLTGYAGNLPDMDLTPVHPRRLCHTHHTVSAALEHGHYTYAVLVSSEDWNGKKAFDRAQSMAEDYTEEDLGHRQHEPEYIEARNGQMKRNPNYLKRHRARPALGCAWLWAALFNWWRTTHATAGQRAALDKADATAKATRLEPDWTLRSSGGPGYVAGYNGLTLSYEPYESVTWEAFRAL